MYLGGFLGFRSEAFRSTFKRVRSSTGAPEPSLELRRPSSPIDSASESRRRIVALKLASELPELPSGRDISQGPARAKKPAPLAGRRTTDFERHQRQQGAWGQNAEILRIWEEARAWLCFA